MHDSSSFSFADFNAAAHIDFITIAEPQDFRARAPFALRRAFTQNRVKYSLRDGYHQATIHDPTKQELQYLINEYWATEILKLEVSIDFKPHLNDQQRAKLEWLHHVLKTSLIPQNHTAMKALAQGKWRRKYLDPQTGRYETDSLTSKGGDRTIIWDKGRGNEQVRLYIKGPDKELPLEEHFVRLEATLNRGGCQSGQVHRMALLPSFMERSRRYLSSLFRVASGIKPTIGRVRTNKSSKASSAALAAEKERRAVDRAWRMYGAGWADRNGRAVIPHLEANRMIGRALKGLRDSLLTLKLPSKVAADPEQLSKFIDMYQ